MSDDSRRDALASYTRKPTPTTTSKSSLKPFGSSARGGSQYGAIGASSRASRSSALASIVVTAAESSRKINKASSNIASLRLTNMKLHGRDDEIKLLRGVLKELAKKKREASEKNVADNDSESKVSEKEDVPPPQAPEDERSPNNMILVRGKSGTGKSALINKGLGETASKLGYIFAKGKFDQKLKRPLSAFSDAMAKLYRYIDKGRSGGKLGMSATLIQEQIQNEFDAESLELLRGVMPGCVELFEAQILKQKSKFAMPSLAEVAVPMVMEQQVSFSSLGSAKQRRVNVVGKEAIIRTHFAVRRLLKIICEHLKGVILFIDDLQWSDNATLELLRSIVLDREFTNLLIVGAYREDEVPDNLPLASFVTELEKQEVSVTQIAVGNLSADYVRPLVAEALGMEEDNERIEALANITHKKTEGNPFFVTMFLTSLFDEKILQYNFGTMKWSWEDEQVDAMIVTDNVASVLVNKMKRLREEAQRMLMVASCLGSSFKVSFVAEVMSHLSDGEIRSSMMSSSASLTLSELDGQSSFASREGNFSSDSSSVASSIKEFEDEGLVETDRDSCYFVHDQIQSAAFELINPEQRDSFRGKIGSILLKGLSSEELDANLFEVVGLLNCAAELITDEDRDQIASLNLKAGTKAAESGAFESAKEFFEAGYAALGPQGWDGDYKTMLDLCSKGAAACYVNGDFETMDKLIDEVLSKDIDVMEKYRVTEVKVQMLHATAKPDISIDVALDFRRQLGLTSMKRKKASTFSILREFMKVSKLLKNKSAEDIANLPPLDDDRHEMGQRLNELLIVNMFQCEPSMLPLVIFSMVTTTLKHGLNSSSCDGIARLGLLFCGPFGKPQKGREMAKAAELILEQPGMQRITSKTMFVTQCFCYHWTAPLVDTIAPLLKGCEEGLAIGDTDSACYCLVARSFNLYFVGRPLGGVEVEMEATIDVMTQIKQDGPQMRIVIILATIRKLRGTDVEADDEKMDSYMAIAEETGNLSLAAFVNCMRLEVLVFFHKWDEAVKLVQNAGDVRVALIALSNAVRFTFLEALVYLKAAQSSSGSKKKKMKKSGKKSMKLIQGWAKNGNVNVVHNLQMLDAELALLDGKVKVAEESFKAAISTSRRNGFIQDRALAHELLSSVYKAQGDEYWRNYHVESAKAAYQEWECDKKVQQFDESE